MAEAPAYTGLREGYVLLPFPEDKQLNPRDIDWRIEALLGRGNFGQVVRGTWRGKPSALKIANPNNGQEAIDLLMEEATMMARMDHPNIVAVHGCCTKNDHFVMVMEMMNQSLADLLDKVKEQQDLQGKLNDGSLTLEALPERRRSALKIGMVPIWHILRDVVRGLQYLHKQKLMHRDIKPSNILLTRDMTAKLCDFGLVREVDPDRSMTNAGSSSYKAPEVIYGTGSYGTSVDIFSLGRVIEKDILPVLPSQPMREVADYCLQPIAGTEHGYGDAASRPTAAQLLKRIDAMIKKHERWHLRAVPPTHSKSGTTIAASKKALKPILQVNATAASLLSEGIPPRSQSAPLGLKPHGRLSISRLRLTMGSETENNESAQNGSHLPSLQTQATIKIHHNPNAMVEDNLKQTTITTTTTTTTLAKPKRIPRRKAAHSRSGSTTVADSASSSSSSHHSHAYSTPTETRMTAVSMIEEEEEELPPTPKSQSHSHLTRSSTAPETAPEYLVYISPAGKGTLYHVEGHKGATRPLPLIKAIRNHFLPCPCMTDTNLPEELKTLFLGQLSRKGPRTRSSLIPASPAKPSPVRARRVPKLPRSTNAMDVDETPVEEANGNDEGDDDEEHEEMEEEELEEAGEGEEEEEEEIVWEEEQGEEEEEDQEADEDADEEATMEVAEEEEADGAEEEEEEEYEYVQEEEEEEAEEDEEANEEAADGEAAGSYYEEEGAEEAAEEAEEEEEAEEAEDAEDPELEEEDSGEQSTLEIEEQPEEDEEEEEDQEAEEVSPKPKPTRNRSSVAPKAPKRAQTAPAYRLRNRR